MVPISLGAAILSSLSYFFSLEADYLYHLTKKMFLEEQKLGEVSIKEFDFIIGSHHIQTLREVGAGTAGCLLANKLSKYHTVLLLEAGGPAPSILQVPAFRGPSRYFKEINYEFHLQQQSVPDRLGKLSTGKVVGGSFAHNELFFIRGNRRDFDTWANLTGDKSLKYKNILPIYKKMESFKGPFKAQRGTQGPIPVQIGGNPTLQAALKMASKELQYNYGDFNGPDMEGFGPFQYSQTREGRAISTCSIFIDPINGLRKSLTVLTYAQVNKVTFNGNVATGVRYSRFGKNFISLAKKEVILSAGAIGTPLLLFKSGIGPAKMLSKAKIPVVADLPVGKILDDHMGLTINVSYNVPLDSFNHNLSQKNFEVYLKRRPDGVLSDIGEHGLGFFVSSHAKKNGESNWPDIQLIWSQDTSSGDGRIIDEITVVVTRPVGKGSLKLNTKAYLRGSRGNTQLALIDYQLFKEKEDLKRVVEGIRIALRVSKTKAMKELGINVIQNQGCMASNEYNSDAYWTCVVKNYAYEFYHPVATCKMGYGPTGKNGVVNSKFRVNGMVNLRIVDASVFPIGTNGNSNAPTMLLAFKAAGSILKDYSEKKHDGGKLVSK